jgi:hypothetical protein
VYSLARKSDLTILACTFYGGPTGFNNVSLISLVFFQLLPRLHEAVLGADSATTVEGALRRCASELQTVCCAHLLRTCDAMITCATTEVNITRSMVGPACNGLVWSIV